MVNNLMNILDEGMHKKCLYYYTMPNNIIPNKLQDLYNKLYNDYAINGDVPREIRSYFATSDCPNEVSFFTRFPYTKLCEILRIVPFIPSLSINISPDWKGTTLSLEHRFHILKEFMDSFLEEYQPFLFTEYAYVVEVGSEGNFPHLHIVLQCNSKTKKQLKSWLAKNAKARINKHFKRSCLKNGIDPVGINYQTCRLNTEEILNDKIDYLFEDRKPKGHKNMAVDNDLFGAVFKSSDWNPQLRVLRVG